MMKLLGEDLYWRLAWNLWFSDDLMAILLGSGGLRVTVSSRLDPLPPWDSNLRPTHQRL
jgi:hypothetical protein